VPPPGPASRALARGCGPWSRATSRTSTSRWPVFWEEAAGANVRDADGNVYVDLTGGFGVALLGHAHPAVHGGAASGRPGASCTAWATCTRPSLKVRSSSGWRA
jgi:glutamate-1-semialdehyde aminotransferase